MVSCRMPTLRIVGIVDVATLRPRLGLTAAPVTRLWLGKHGTKDKWNTSLLILLNEQTLGFSFNAMKNHEITRFSLSDGV